MLQQLDLSNYVGKSNGDEISASEWNAVFGNIANSINSLVSAVNAGGSGGSSSGGGSGTGGLSTALYVNGELFTGTTLVLNPQGTYHLQGELNGLIVIDVSTEAGAGANASKTYKNTYIILDGVTIISPEETAISYNIPDGWKGYKGLVITLAADSVNTLMCTTVAASGNDQKGTIYSDNNLRIQGSGYLNCITRCGHGMRASEIKLYNPHIYVDAIHDGIHAKCIYIYDGAYYFTNINDCFGTSDKSDACIYVCGGKIIANNMKSDTGNLFDYRSGFGYYIKRPEIITNIPVSQYATSGGQTTLASGDLKNIDTVYGSGTVTLYANKKAYEDGAAGQVISVTDGAYKFNSSNSITTNTGSEKAYLIVSGLITNPIIVEASFSSGTEPSINIALNNAYISTASDNPCIFYGSTDKRVKVESVKGTVNIIKQTATTATSSSIDYDAIKSESNISLELNADSTLYISSTLGDGIDGSDVTCTDSTGVLYIENCGQRGIKGTTIVIGPNTDITAGVPKFYVETSDERLNLSYTLATDAMPATYFDGCIIARNNCKKNTPSAIGNTTGDASKLVGFADIYARKGKRKGNAEDKGSFFTLKKYLTGPIICEHFGAMISADFNFSYNIYVSKLISDGLYNIERLTNEQYVVYPKYSAPIIDETKFKATASA